MLNDEAEASDREQRQEEEDEDDDLSYAALGVSKPTSNNSSSERSTLRVKRNFIERWEECLLRQETVMEELTDSIRDFKCAVRELTTQLRKGSETHLEAEWQEIEERPSEETEDITEHPASTKESKCFRCNKYNHKAINCPLVEYNMWYCFFCQAVREHKGDDCPNKNNPKDGYIKSSRYSSSEAPYKSEYRGSRGSRGYRGRSSYRGGYRGKDVSFKRKIIPPPGRSQKRYEKFDRARAMHDSDSEVEWKYQ